MSLYEAHKIAEHVHKKIEDEMPEVISVINDLLERLRNLPDTGIAISHDLKIGEKDFLYL